MQVVLADSTIVNANSKENTDLFWALKGGCSNFGKLPNPSPTIFRNVRLASSYLNLTDATGIVTGLEMSTTPNKVWCDSRLYRPSENDQLLKAIMLYHKEIENNNKAVLYFHMVKDATLLVCFYGEPAESRPAVFDCF